MKSIFVLIGKSAVGKDRIYRDLLSDETLHLAPLITCTTRPMRAGEENGREYHFVSDFSNLQDIGTIINETTYETAQGDWSYATVLPNNFPPDIKNIITKGTIPDLKSFQEFFQVAVFPIYIEVETATRLQRALDREKLQKQPDYIEMCRRFISDEQDFNGFQTQATFNNTGYDACLRQIKEYIHSNGDITISRDGGN